MAILKDLKAQEEIAALKAQLAELQVKAMGQFTMRHIQDERGLKSVQFSGVLDGKPIKTKAISDIWLTRVFAHKAKIEETLKTPVTVLKSKVA